MRSKPILNKDRQDRVPDPAAHGAAEGDSERRTSTWDLDNAPRNYLWLMASQIGAAAFAFATVWLITQQIGRDGYGLVVAVIAASQIAQVFTNWTTVAVVKYGVEEFVASAVIARTFWSRFAILAVNLSGMLLLAPTWFPWLNGLFKFDPQLIWLVLTHFAVTALWVHVQMGLQAAKLLRTQGLLQMGERLVAFVAVGVFFVSDRLDLSTAIICYIAASVIALVSGTVLLRSFIFRRFSFDIGFFRKILVYSIPLLPYWFIGFLSGNYVDAALIKKYTSDGDLGVYGIATAINGMVLQAPTIANTILLPLFLTQRAESGGERSFFFFRHVLPGAVLGWGLGCVVLSFGAWFVIPLVFKPDFAGAGLPLWILLAGSAFWIPVALGYAALANAAGTTYVPLVAATSAALVNIIGDIYLIPRYGMVGSAWATLMAYTASVAIFSVLLRKSQSLPLSWIFTAFVPSLVSAALISTIGSPWLSLVGCAVTAALIALLHRRSIEYTWSFFSNLRERSS